MEKLPEDVPVFEVVEKTQLKTKTVVAQIFIEGVVAVGYFPHAVRPRPINQPAPKPDPDVIYKRVFRAERLQSAHEISLFVPSCENSSQRKARRCAFIRERSEERRILIA